MIIPSNSDKFNKEWLELISHDPVHPTIAKETRAEGTRTVLMYDEGDEHQCMICTKGLCKFKTLFHDVDSNYFRA